MREGNWGVDSVSMVSALVALLGAGTAAFFGYWQQRRLYNILHGQVLDRAPGNDAGYLTAFLGRGTPAEAEYARRSTVFVLAEYLAWAEVLRRDVQFLNMGGSRVNRANHRVS